MTKSPTLLILPDYNLPSLIGVIRIDENLSAHTVLTVQLLQSSLCRSKLAKLLLLAIPPHFKEYSTSVS